MLQAHLFADAVLIAKLEESLTDDGSDLSLAVAGQHANGADLAVGDKEGAAIARQAARLGEQRERKRAVTNVLRTAAGIGAHVLFLQVEPPDLVKAGHGDE